VPAIFRKEPAMKYSVFYPTEIKDIYNDNIDVCVTREDGKTLTFVFITPENLKHLMLAENTKYIDFRFRFIVVKELSEKIIEEVLEQLMAQEYFFNFYGSDMPEQ
jgi:phosphorylcholine metabolism protein LicD